MKRQKTTDDLTALLKSAKKATQQLLNVTVRGSLRWAADSIKNEESKHAELAQTQSRLGTVRIHEQDGSITKQTVEEYSVGKNVFSYEEKKPLSSQAKKKKDLFFKNKDMSKSQICR